jgi:hypothetical protein
MTWIATKQAAHVLGISESSVVAMAPIIRSKRKRDLQMPGKGYMLHADDVELVRDISAHAQILPLCAARVVAYLRREIAQRQPCAPTGRP